MNLPRMNLLYLLAFTDESFRFGILHAIVSLFFLNWIFCTFVPFLCSLRTLACTRIAVEMYKLEIRSYTSIYIFSCQVFNYFLYSCLKNLNK